MAWTLRFDPRAKRDLSRLDTTIQKRIVAYLEQRVLTASHPRLLGKSLSGDLARFWRYRVQDYRILCELKNDQLVVLVVEVGHRKNVYE